VPFVVAAIENAVAAMGDFRADGPPNCERIGGKAKTAQSKGDRKSNHGLTQHEFPIHRELPFVGCYARSMARIRTKRTVSGLGQKNEL
jgi:hypothetical protein